MDEAILEYTCMCGSKMTPHARFQHFKSKIHQENIKRNERVRRLSIENETLKKLVASLLISEEEKEKEKRTKPREVLITREKIKDELFAKIFPNSVQLVQSKLEDNDEDPHHKRMQSK